MFVVSMPTSAQSHSFDLGPGQEMNTKENDFISFLRFADLDPEFHRFQHFDGIFNESMDWFKGKSTGNHRFSH